MKTQDSHRSPPIPRFAEVLKDVRLRCTFASTDSGGISGQRLAVLDKYAHVLKEQLGLAKVGGIVCVGGFCLKRFSILFKQVVVR